MDGRADTKAGDTRGAAKRGFYRTGAGQRRRRGALLAAAAATGLALGPLAACTTVPISGRSAFNIIPEEEAVQLGSQAYQETLAGERVVPTGPQKQMVERVAQRLIAVAEGPDYPWEVALIQNDETANAFALPGGKMAVYTGILPFTQDEAGLAVVMGHEIAHVIARHGTERLSIEFTAQQLSALAAGKLGGDPQLWAAAKTVMLSLPFSRKHELEADYLGLIFMARAGYDPRAAPEFWRRMSAGKQGQPLEWLSTHPSDQRRVEELEDHMDEALRAYTAAAGRP